VSCSHWLVKNPRFARNLVFKHRAWVVAASVAALSRSRTIFARTIRRAQPELLAFLENEFVSSGYDFKQLYRLILNSKTYQLASIPQSRSPEAVAKFRFFIRCDGWTPRGVD